MADDGRQPVVVGGQLELLGSGPAQGEVAGGVPFGRRGGEPPLDGRGHPDLAVPAGRRVDEVDEADRGDVALAGVVDGDGEEVMAQTEPGERIDPALAGEVGDHGHEAATPADHGHPVDRRGEVGATESLRRWGRGDGADDGAHLVAPEARGEHLEVRAGDEHRAEPVLVPRGEEPDRRRGREGDLRLVGARRPEAHRRRGVDDEPRLEVTIGDLLAHVRLLRAGGDVPVDAPHVVARLVEPGLTGLAPVPGGDPLVVAVQHAVEAPVDGELEGADELGDLTRSAGRPASSPARSGRSTRRSSVTRQRASRAALGFGETHVAGTVERIRLTRWSGVMSRARAS